MNQASLYHRASAVQRRDSKQILQEYMKVMQWRDDGRDTLIDVGCGSGNVLMDYIYPLLPANFQFVLGADISKKMVEFARKFYSDYDRALFDQLDIATEQLPLEMCGQFDHVTSFYCLHWVRNQNRALENIFRLLRRDGGDCLLVFLANNQIFDVYLELARTPQWCAYMTDVEQYISPLHNSADPCAEYQKALHDAGFVDYTVEIRHETYVYDGVQNLKDNIKAVCPFLERIPPEQHEQFLDDIVSAVVRMKLREGDFNVRDFKVISPYKLIVAYARKPSEFVSNVIGDAQRAFKGLE